MLPYSWRVAAAQHGVQSVSGLRAALGVRGGEIETMQISRNRQWGCLVCKVQRPPPLWPSSYMPGVEAARIAGTCRFLVVSRGCTAVPGEYQLVLIAESGDSQGKPAAKRGHCRL